MREERSMRHAFKGVLLCLGALVLASFVKAGGGTEVTLDDGMKSKTPSTWRFEKASNKLRVYQFKLPKTGSDAEDAELVIFFFGKGQGGGTEENVKRWQSMFQPPKGMTIEEATKVDKLKVGKVPVTYVDVHGTFLSKFPPFDPNAKVTRKENYRRLGVVFDSENGPYFITMTGPAATVEHHKKGFDDWLKNFK
jgi:hypothetical protein